MSNNKRIARNTLLLYIRTFIILLISLYTSRVVLNALGVDDYGTYNVVGGFVAMFSLLSGALSNAISRYITFELGRGDKEKLKEVFSTSVTVQIILALVVVVLAEVFGIWFLNTQMNIPDGRMVAANWVFQCSLLTFAINLISIPYNAAIIAHERMNAFAYISILEAFLKLGAVFLLYVIGFDKLIVYSVLLTAVAVLIRLIYGGYCKHHFEECSYRFSINKPLISQMTSLAGWNMLGSSGQILNSHGINLLMNLFFGVTVNAARGLAVQVNGAVNQFVNSFTTAVNPQITKTYAKGEKDYLFKLVMMSSKYSFFLMLLLAAPIIVETPIILKIWLNNVPEFTVLFVRLTLIASSLSSITLPLYTLALATGNIKKYQIVVGGLSLSCFFITFVCYKLGSPVESAYYVYLFVTISIMVARLKIVSELTGLNIKVFVNKVILRIVYVLVFLIVVIAPLNNLLDKESVILSVLKMAITAVVAAFVIWLVGLTGEERRVLLNITLKRNV